MRYTDYLIVVLERHLKTYKVPLRCAESGRPRALDYSSHVVVSIRSKLILGSVFQHELIKRGGFSSSDA